MARCPREGTRLMFNTNPASRMLYSDNYRLPPAGTIGTVTAVAIGIGKRTCMPGPGGGLIYVDWGEYGIMGVAPRDVTLVSKSKRGTSRGKR
jgi:hypothetical protein